MYIFLEKATMETGHIGRTEGTLGTMSMMNQGTQTENEEDTNNKEKL